MTEEIKSVSVRIPSGLYTRLAAAAHTDHRSLNGQVLALIEAALDQREDDRG